MSNNEPMPGPDWCAIHNRSEPLRDGDFKVCGECFHVWRTRAGFMLDVTREYGTDPTWDVPTDPAKVYACPLCTHDF